MSANFTVTAGLENGQGNMFHHEPMTTFHCLTQIMELGYSGNVLDAANPYNQRRQIVQH